MLSFERTYRDQPDRPAPLSQEYGTTSALLITGSPNHPIDAAPAGYWTVEAPVTTGGIRTAQAGRMIPFHPFDSTEGLYRIYQQPGVTPNASDFTVLAVVHGTDGVATNNLHFGRGGSGSDDSVRVYYTNATTIRFAWIDSSPAQYNLDLSVGTYFQNQILRVAIAKRGTTRSLYVIDGNGTRYIGTQTSGGATARSGTRGWFLGFRLNPGDGSTGRQGIAHFSTHNRAMEAAEAFDLLLSPGKVFATRRIWVPVAATASDTLITTGIGAATASGTTAVVNRALVIATGTGAASAAGVQAIINRAQFIAATIGAATASGTTASVNLARFVATGIGAATAAGTQASIVADGAVVITTGIGAATAAGVQARIDLARFIATGIGAAAASGTQATITNAADVVVSTGVGAAVADGAAATFIRNVLVACGVGNATADGTQATVIGEGLEPAETRRRGGGNRFVLARKRLPSAYLIDWLTNEEPSEETKRVIREIKAGRPLPERLDPPKVEKQITPEQLAAKLIPRRLINLSEVLPVEQTQLIRKAVRIAQERDDEDILMLL